MLLSFTLQILAVSGGVVICILTVDKLGAFSLPQPMPPMPRVPRPMKLVPVTHIATNTASGLRVAFRPFVAPTRIPDKVSMIADAPDMQVTQSSSVGDLSSNVIGAIGVTAGVTNAHGIAPPPQAPPPTRPEVRERNPVVRIGGAVLEAKLVKRVMPVFPALARQMRISGTVRLEGVIARDGSVANLQVIADIQC